MGKFLSVVVALALAAAAAPSETPAALAQILPQTVGSCPAGTYLAADGSCAPVNNNQGNNAANPAGTQQGTPADQLSQQYPGLQSGYPGQNLNFYDQSGLPGNTQAEQQARAQAEQLARLGITPTPPTGFQQMVQASVGKLLPIYGDSLFQREVPTTFAPLTQVPVTADYVIGPGDQLVIRVWGQVSFNAQVTVDRSGAIYLPQVGSIHVAGLQYSQLQDQIRTAISRIYKNFTVDVEMGQLRSIQVFLVGQARRPGTYTLSSLSTLVTAIFATGGPSVQGSLRDVQLRRGGQTITHYDLYDLLINGDKSKDVALLPGDVIYIPPVGAQIAVTGSVRNPAIYELHGETTVAQALDFAGGLTPEALVGRAFVDRVDEHRARTTVDITLGSTANTTPLKDGDIVRILPISPQFQNTILLRGNVAQPGRFGWHEGMKLSDILPDPQALITRDYWLRRNRQGIPGPTFQPENATNPDLYPVQGNGTLRGMQGGLNQSSAEMAPSATQGITEVPSEQATQPLPIQGANEGNPQSAAAAANAAQQNRTQTTPAQSNLGTLAGDQQRRFGQPTPPTRPPLQIALPVPEIDWSYAVIERQDPKTLTTTLVPFNLGALVRNHDASQDLPLEPGDVVNIFSQADIRVPQEQRTKFVRLEGEFNAAGVYSVKPGETLRELVTRAGGFTSKAYLFGSELTRESTRVIQQQRLNDYISNLELEIDRSNIAATTGVTPQDTTAATLASQRLVDRFRTLRATGRIVLNISPKSSGVNSLPDLPLEDGDRFVVPSRPDTINVVGAVYDQNTFIFRDREHLAPYLRMAGGPTRDADSNHAFIIRADGSVVSKQATHGVFGNTFNATALYPGDTIVVPEKVARPSTLRNVLNLTQLFSQLALGAASIAVVYR